MCDEQHVAKALFLVLKAATIAGKARSMIERLRTEHDMSHEHSVVLAKAVTSLLGLSHLEATDVGEAVLDCS